MSPGVWFVSMMKKLDRLDQLDQLVLLLLLLLLLLHHTHVPVLQMIPLLPLFLLNVYANYSKTKGVMKVVLYGQKTTSMDGGDDLHKVQPQYFVMHPVVHVAQETMPELNLIFTHGVQ